ncbi:hypothetical protein [Jannaschia sp. LMIT008]|uniref:hypothetical protein n=1 Tax=Jannaschia maritima TaxID=3032585 RepID=UPI0028120CFD|nr:hypothetical protein [Jannaschia sp. LMIT008]
MSAPNTNLEKQEKRHAGPLIGITACIVFAAIIITAYFGFIAAPAEDGAVDAGAAVTATD